MNPTRTDSLAYRAAVYVGMEDKPRRSISLRPNVVMVIWDDGYGLVYSEEVGGRRRGEWFRLTQRRCAALRSILEDLDPKNLK